MRRLGGMLLAVWFVFGVGIPNVVAITEFRKAFMEKYVTPSDDDEFKKLARKAGCNICHVPRQARENHNPYGEQLKQLISGAAKERLAKATKDGRRKEEVQALVAELQAAFPQVAAMKNDAGESYGERIESGRLPVDLPKK